MSPTSSGPPVPLHGSPFVRPLLIVLLASQLALLAISIPGHPLHIDEAWIGEQAYFLARDGYVHSDLFEGLAGSEHRQVVYHRLFVLAGSLSVQLFGWDINALRVVTIVAGLGLLAAMALYMRREAERPAVEILMALAIMLLVPINFYHIKIYRPEFMMTLFGFLSYWSLERYEKNDKGRYAAASGFLAALAALSHLYGLIFLLAAAVMLLRMRRWKGIALYAAIALLPFLPYLIDIATHFELFRAQISSPMAARKTTFSLATPFLNLLEEHKRLFRKAEIIPIVALFLLALAINMRERYRQRRLFYEYTILLVILLGAIAPDKLVTRYAIPLFPFFAIEISNALRTAWHEREISRFLRIPAYVMIAILAGYGLYYQAGESFSGREHPAELNAAIGASLPPGARCVGPMNLIFNEIQRRPIVGLYMARKEHGDTLTLAAATDFARKHNAGYIITNRLATNEEEITDLGSAKNGTKDSLAVLAETEEYTILKVE